MSMNPETIEIHSESANESESESNEITNENSEFEFPCVPNTSLITAEDLFSNGMIRPFFAYPENDTPMIRVPKPPVKPLTRQSLGSLFMEELRGWSSDDVMELRGSSSDDPDEELQGLSPDMYCEWTPRKSKMMVTLKKWRTSTFCKGVLFCLSPKAFIVAKKQKYPMRISQ